MCEHGDTIQVEVTIPAEVAYDGRTSRRVKPIDRCIAPIVQALDGAGIIMVGSCCGHFRTPGEIRFLDGRVLTVHPDVLDDELLDGIERHCTIAVHESAVLLRRRHVVALLAEARKGRRIRPACLEAPT